MGGFFDIKTKTITCNGEQVTAKLNQVFKNPGTSKYQQAQANNTFGAIANIQGNWKDLIIAYLVAGVDVGNEWPAWCCLLGATGRGTHRYARSAKYLQYRPNAFPRPERQRGNGHKHARRRRSRSHTPRVGGFTKHDRFTLPADLETDP